MSLGTEYSGNADLPQACCDRGTAAFKQNGQRHVAPGFRLANDETEAQLPGIEVQCTAARRTAHDLNAVPAAVIQTQCAVERLVPAEAGRGTAAMKPQQIAALSQRPQFQVAAVDGGVIGGSGKDGIDHIYRAKLHGSCHCPGSGDRGIRPEPGRPYH